MAARRRRSTGIKKSVNPQAARIQRGRSAGPRVGRDGKARVACPGCGAEYLVPEASLDRELACRSCNTVFVPSEAARSHAPEKFNATPYYVGGGLLVLVVGIYFAMRSGPVEATPKKDPEPRVVIHRNTQNPRARGVKEWGDAIRTGDRLNLASLTDAAALAPRFALTFTGEETTDAVVEKLMTDESTKYFRDFQIDSAVLHDSTEHDAATGRVVLYMTPIELRHIEQGYIYERRRMETTVSFRFDGDRAQVTGFEYTVPASERKVSTSSHKTHKEIGEAKEVERTIAGQKVKVTEAQIVPLGHLEDTPEPLRKEIDRLIEDIIKEDPPGASNRARLKLQDIGKPAVPRLLNKMYETKMDSTDAVQALRRICGALEDITGQRFGFTPAMQMNGESTEEWRTSVLRQWYGYWTTHHDREDWDLAIEKEESLDIEPTKKN